MDTEIYLIVQYVLHILHSRALIISKHRKAFPKDGRPIDGDQFSKLLTFWITWA